MKYPAIIHTLYEKIWGMGSHPPILLFLKIIKGKPHPKSVSAFYLHTNKYHAVYIILKVYKIQIFFTCVGWLFFLQFQNGRQDT